MATANPDLSAEEALVKAEQNANADREKRAKRNSMAVKFLKEKLLQEEQNSRINSQKLNSQWIEIMRKAKSEELRNEILILSQTFERVIDRKEAILSGLVVYLTESEQQDAMSSRTHTRNLDKLIGLQEQRVAQLHKEFSDELALVSREFMAERELIVTRHQHEMSDVKDIIFTMQGRHADVEAAAAADLNSKRDEIRTRSLEAKSTLKATLESVVADLWEVYQQTLRSYEHSTADKKADFERLREKDAASSETISQQARKLQRLQDRIAAKKAAGAQTQKAFEQRNRDLKAEKESVLVHLQRLKEQMSSTRARARTSLTQLSIDARSCEDSLQERLTLAETILKQAEVCRKLETEEEKVMPFYAESQITPESAETEQTQQPIETASGSQAGAIAASTTTPETTALAFLESGERADEVHALDRFWKRYNKVLLERAAIERDRDDSLAENQKLRALLKQYLDGISVNEDVLSQQNSLFIVNGRSNVPSIPVGDARVAPSQAPAQQVTVQSGGGAVAAKRRVR